MAHGHLQEQLRARIDAGQTGDKVAYPDPAAAPLDTDEEAGGASSRLDPASLSDRERTAMAEPHRPRPGPHGTPGIGSAIWISVLCGGLAAGAVIWLSLLG